MVILGYICEGITIPLIAAFCFYEASEGYIFSALLSFLSLSLSVAAIVLIFLMAETKNILALRAIQIYLWLTIPYSMIVSIVSGLETSDSTQFLGIPMALVIGVPVAIYWQQKSHSAYLKSYASER